MKQDRRCWWEVEVGQTRGQNVEMSGGCCPSHDPAHCLGRLETSSSVTPSMSLRDVAVTKPQQTSQGHSCRSTWQGKCPCSTVPLLCLLWRWQGKRDQPGKTQRADGSQHGWGWVAVFCLTGVTAREQRQREKCCSDNSNQHSQGEVWEKASNKVAGKAEEEIVQV